MKKLLFVFAMLCCLYSSAQTDSTNYRLINAGAELKLSRKLHNIGYGAYGAGLFIGGILLADTSIKPVVGGSVAGLFFILGTILHFSAAQHVGNAGEYLQDGKLSFRETPYGVGLVYRF